MKAKSVNLRFEDATQHKLFTFAAKLRRMSLNGFLLYAADAVSRECQQAPDRKHDWNTVNTGSDARGRCNFCGIKHKDWLSIMKLAAALFISFMLFAPPMTQMATAQVPGLRAPEPVSPNRELHYEASNEVNQHVNVGTYPVTFVKLEPSALLPPGTLILVAFHVFIENPAIACKVLCAMGGEITIADGVQP